MDQVAIIESGRDLDYCYVQKQFLPENGRSWGPGMW